MLNFQNSIVREHIGYYYINKDLAHTPVCSAWDKGYRYGFNGKEIDKGSEGMGGGGSTYDYGFRIYNPSLGRFLSVDPLFKTYPWFTPYQFAGNGPILNIDVDGLENEPTQPNTTGNKVEASDNTNQTTNLSDQVKTNSTYYTPDGGSFQTLQIKNVKNFEKDKDYTIDGNKIQVKENSVKSFEFNGIVYEAQFDKNTGNFTKYLGSDGSVIDYSIKSDADLGKTQQMSIAAPLQIVAAGIAVIASAALVYQTAKVVHSITLSKPDIVIGGFIYSKQTGNQKSDEFSDKSDEWVKEEYYNLKGKLDKVQKAYKKKLEKELKARNGKNTGKERGNKQ
jgi:RHS repeat-associated protein